MESLLRQNSSDTRLLFSEPLSPEEEESKKRLCPDASSIVPVEDSKIHKMKMSIKARSEYIPMAKIAQLKKTDKKGTTIVPEFESKKLIEAKAVPVKMIEFKNAAVEQPSTANVINNELEAAKAEEERLLQSQEGTTALSKYVPPNILATRRQAPQVPKPTWHAPWKLMRVISGHTGWVRALDIEPGNEWFATGSGDRTIKIWDLATGTLKLSLTGHISSVRGIKISNRHPYLFSTGEDKMIKCWDLEQNKVIRHYHGHLSGIYALDLHPTLDLLVTAGRDATARVWDMRTKQAVHVLRGHTNTINCVKAQAADPQIITSSMDSTVRTWDLVAGKTLANITHHKKSVRALAIDPNEFTFYSASPDSIRKWKLPETKLMMKFPGHNAVINTLSVNEDRVLFSGADNGSMYFWDAKSGYNFQRAETIVQPGSLDSEAGVFCSSFDNTGLRLLTGEADKTIKIWKEDEKATPESHPIVDWKPPTSQERY